MKASQYNIVVPDDSSERLILFNSLYGSLVVFEPDEAGLANEILRAPATKRSASPDIYDLLCRHKYLVPDDTNEFLIIQRRKSAGIQDKNRLDLIIMPTMDCNFACPYCYEERRPSQMTQRTHEAIKSWMTIEIPKHKMLLLYWFGGEPLMGYRSVVALTRHGLDIARANGVAFIGHMTTNGYLLNERRVQELVSLEILDYQVTVDGDRESHNKVRVLRNGSGTFDRVVGNIALLMQGDSRVRVSLRINFSKHNLSSVPSLLEVFPSKLRSRIRVSLEPIFGNCPLAAATNLTQDDMSGSLGELYALAEREGYSVVHGLKHGSTGKLVYCYAERESQFIINYNRDVFKCSVCTFREEERVGYIDDNGTFVKHQAQWDRFVGHVDLSDACRKCSYLPLCMGGCRKKQLASNDAGSQCGLVPTNATYILKQIAYGRLGKLFRTNGKSLLEGWRDNEQYGKGVMPVWKC